MATPIVFQGLPAGTARVLAALGDALRASTSLVQRLDAFLLSRRRAAQDRELLATMSDRELADIGLPRASVDAAAHGAWARDPMI